MGAISRHFRAYLRNFKSWRDQMRESPTGRIQIGLMVFSTIAVPYAIFGFQRLPGGYVGVIQDIWGRYKPDLYDDERTFFIFPIYERLHMLRIWPVRKRLVEEFVSKDGKVVEVVIYVRLRAKPWWAQEIVKKLGTDYARHFIVMELALDAEKVVSDHNYSALVADDEETEAICEELIQRTREAALFNHLDLLDMTVLFRDPLDAPVDSSTSLTTNS